MLEISKIKEGLQARAAINHATIAGYVEHLKNGGSFPPVVVFFDSKDYWLADGWHRLLAHKDAGQKIIHEEIKIGTKRDALKYALGANSAHGLPRTNADKRNAVSLALADEEWSEMTTRDIAAMCCVSNALVSEMQRGITPKEKTEKNNTRAKESVLTVNKTAPQPASSLKVENSENKNPSDDNHYDPSEDALSEAHETVIQLAEENQRLKDAIAVGNLPEPEQSAGDIIKELRARIKTLDATCAAITSMRDSLLLENKALKEQCAMQRREIKKLGGK